jgi:AcrR family transcriptional regulator
MSKSSRRTKSAAAASAKTRKKAVTPRPRLNRRDWLEAALAVLIHEGIGAVSIERLATSLHVTRGSFYHHFKNRDDLKQALLDHWQAEATVRIREEILALKLEPKTTLLALSRAIRHRKASVYDVAFRNWAMHDEMALVVVRKTDDIRLGFIRDLFADAGYTGMDLENRARLFYYYELMDPMVFAKQSEELEDALVEVRHRLLTGPPAES